MNGGAARIFGGGWAGRCVGRRREEEGGAIDDSRSDGRRVMRRK